MKKTFLVMTFTILIIFPANAFSDELFGLKGDKLGSTLLDFKVKHDESYCFVSYPKEREKIAEKWQFNCSLCLPTGSYQNKTTTIAGVQADIVYSFIIPDIKTSNIFDKNFLLWLIQADFDHKNFEPVTKALKQKYGSPTEHNLSTLKNAFGAKFQNREFKWENKLSSISIFEYGDDIFTSRIIFLHSDLFKEHKRRKELYNAKKSGSDL